MWTNQQSKSKYALILVCSGSGYARGANAIINAMDYYNNKIDLHFIYEDMPEGYIDRLKHVSVTSLNYRIVLQDFQELTEKMNIEYPDELWKNDAYHRSCYIRHWYMTQLAKTQYKVTGFIESDALLLNNITPWFKLVEGSNYLLTAYHSFQSFELENYTQKEMPFVQPLYIHPAICEPKKWKEVFKLIMKKGAEQHLVDMMAFNQSILLTGKSTDVVILSDQQWLGGYIWQYPLRRIELADNKHYIVNYPFMTRVNMLHGKWYSRGFRHNQLLAASDEHKEVMKHNLDIIVDEYNFFNEHWKITLIPPTVE